MKKFIIILLAACLILGCAVGYFAAKNGANSAALPAPADEVPAEETGSGAVRTLDYAAIRALHEPNEIAGTVAGRDVTWEEYFYWLHSEGAEAEQYIQSLAMYGQSLDWTDKLSADSEETLAEYVVTLAQLYSGQLNVIEAVAAENGVVLTEENEKDLADRLQQTIASACGEGATEQDFNALLEERLVSRSMYDRLERANYLYQNTFIALYGENGEKLSEEEALAFLRDGEYLCASHILFATMDLTTYETLDEEAAAAKLQQAEAVSAELRAIEDPQARAARFAELKQQYCEDSGKERFPEGYLFTPGTMVAEFESGVKELGEYEVSEPILTSYGYHVIMRLPLSVEMTMDYSSAGTPLNARAVCADKRFGDMMEERMNAVEFVLRDGFAVDLTQYLK